MGLSGRQRSGDESSLGGESTEAHTIGYRSFFTVFQLLSWLGVGLAVSAKNALKRDKIYEKASDSAVIFDRD